MQRCRKGQSMEVLEHRFGDGVVREFRGNNSVWKLADNRFGIPVNAPREVFDVQYITLQGEIVSLRDLLLGDRRIGFLEGWLDLYGKSGQGIVYGTYIPELGMYQMNGERITFGLKTRPFFQSPFALFALLHEVAHVEQKRPRRFRGWRLQRIQLERDAWAYALWIVRRFRRQGVDLVSGVSTGELFRYTHAVLYTYELTSKVVSEAWLRQRERDCEAAYLRGDIAGLMRNALRPKREQRKTTRAA